MQDFYSYCLDLNILNQLDKGRQRFHSCSKVIAHSVVLCMMFSSEFSQAIIFLCSQGNKCLHQCKPAHPPNQPHTADLQNRGLAPHLTPTPPKRPQSPPFSSSLGEQLLKWQRLEEHLTHICKLELIFLGLGSMSLESRF